MTIRRSGTEHREATYESWVGRRYGDWTVIDLAGIKSNNLQVVCRCRCGATAVVATGNLIVGRTQRCCRCRMESQPDEQADAAARRWAGRRLRFGTVVSYLGSRRIRIRCDCGRVFDRDAGPSVSGRCKKCSGVARGNGRDYAGGMSIGAVAEVLGVTRQAVSLYKIRHGKAALEARINAAWDSMKKNIEAPSP